MTRATIRGSLVTCAFVLFVIVHGCRARDPKKFFFDMGANHGQSLRLFSSVVDDSRDYVVFSAEPNEDLWPDIETAMRELFDDATLIRKGVWDDDTELEFYKQTGKSKGRSSGSTLVRGKKTLGHHAVERVPVFSLSRLMFERVRECDFVFLKLDVEGAEYVVLRDLFHSGAIHMVDVLAIEFHESKFVKQARTIEHMNARVWKSRLHRETNVSVNFMWDAIITKHWDDEGYENALRAWQQRCVETAPIPNDDAPVAEYDLWSRNGESAWQLFVLTYRFIDDSMYAADSSFDNRYFTFLVTPGRDKNLSPASRDDDTRAPTPKLSYNASAGHKIVYESHLPVYDSRWQASTYLSLSMIYHAACNNLCAAYSHACGFIENDIRLTSKRQPLLKVTQHLDSLARSGERFVAFLGACHPLSRFISQDKAALVGMIDDYNSFFKPETHFRLDQFDVGSTVNSQQSWLADKQTNADILRFIQHIMDDNVIGKHRWRGRPSYFMDRYQAIALLLYARQYKIRVYPLCLHHTAVGTWKRLTRASH